MFVIVRFPWANYNEMEKQYIPLPLKQTFILLMSPSAIA